MSLVCVYGARKNNFAVAKYSELVLLFYFNRVRIFWTSLMIFQRDIFV